MTIDSYVPHGAGLAPVTIEFRNVGGPLTIGGVSEQAAKELAVIVSSALVASGFARPSGRVEIAGAPKDSSTSGLALPIAVELEGRDWGMARAPIVYGDLGLNGATRTARGTTAARVAAERIGRPIIVSGFDARTLGEIIERGFECCAPALVLGTRHNSYRFSDLAASNVDPRYAAGVEQAAVTGRGLLLVGPPGGGKTMAAVRVADRRGPLSDEESRETSAIHSIAGLLEPTEGLLSTRPVRAPHHTASDIGLVGGGSPLRPGEVSLAHNGVLVLDELPEFRRAALDAVAVAVREGEVRTRGVVLPAKVQLVATMNPCPCGYKGTSRVCGCAPDQIARYRARVERIMPLFPIVVDITKEGK